MWWGEGGLFMEDLGGIVLEGTQRFVSRGLRPPQGTESMGQHRPMASKGALLYYFLFFKFHQGIAFLNTTQVALLS